MPVRAKGPPAPVEIKRNERGQFLPGYAPNPAGRTPGSRNRLSAAFITALCDDFEEHGAEAIAEMRLTDPTGYVRVIAALQPKQVEAELNEDNNINNMSLEELRDSLLEYVIADEELLRMLGERLERQMGDQG